MRLFVFPLVSLLFVGACARKPQATAPAATASPSAAVQQPAPAAAQPVIIFSRTPCMGTCPHFKATIYPDGRMHYEGFKFAPVEGVRDLRVPEARIAAIREQADKINFAKLKSTYSSGLTADLPSTILIIRQPDGTTKSVQVEEDAPADLTQLLNFVNAEVEQVLGVSTDR